MKSVRAKWRSRHRKRTMPGSFSSAASTRHGRTGWSAPGKGAMTARSAGSRFSSHGPRGCTASRDMGSSKCSTGSTSRGAISSCRVRKATAKRAGCSLRSPVRPNPIGTSLVKFERVEGNSVYVRGLDCLDGTPLVDLKPDRCLFTPLAPPQPGDFQKG